MRSPRQARGGWTAGSRGETDGRFDATSGPQMFVIGRIHRDLHDQDDRTVQPQGADPRSSFARVECAVRATEECRSLQGLDVDCRTATTADRDVAERGREFKAGIATQLIENTRRAEATRRHAA